MSIKETIWKIEPHTQAKHAILENYLKAWLPIMSRVAGRILYIDGFSGPGQYLDNNGEPTIVGSPIIAINAALQHKLPLNSEIIFIFIEQRSDRCEHLRNLLKSKSLPNNFKYEVIESKFDETLSRIFDQLEEQKKKLAPTFAFIDPFGYSDTPLSVIKRLMENPMCEVLINFMYHGINRFLDDPTKAKHFNILFGTEEWRKLAQIKDAKERKLEILNLYQRQLVTEAKIKFVRFFEMVNKFNQTEYFLFFGTNNKKGLKEMKRAMWKVDPFGSFRFSDRTDPNQAVLFEPKPNYTQLKKLIVAEFTKKTVSIENIEEFIIIKTPFRETHYKKQILAPMERTDEIIVNSSKKRRRGTFPDGTIIKFLI